MSAAAAISRRCRGPAASASTFRTRRPTVADWMPRGALVLVMGINSSRIPIDQKTIHLIIDNAEDDLALLLESASTGERHMISGCRARAADIFERGKGECGGTRRRIRIRNDDNQRTRPIR